MARSLSTAKTFSVIVSGEFSNAIFRRGFAVAADTAMHGSVASGGSGTTTASASVMKKNVGEESSEKAPWIPDPKTGYYRPATVSQEIDPAELRAILLNNKQ